MDIQKLYNQLSQDPNYTDIGNNIQEFANNYFDDDNNTAQLYDLLLNDNSYETFTGNGYESFSDLKKKDVSESTTLESDGLKSESSLISEEEVPPITTDNLFVSEEEEVLLGDSNEELSRIEKRSLKNLEDFKIKFEAGEWKKDVASIKLYDLIKTGAFGGTWQLANQKQFSELFPYLYSAGVINERQNKKLGELYNIDTNLEKKEIGSQVTNLETYVNTTTDLNESTVPTLFSGTNIPLEARLNIANSLFKHTYGYWADNVDPSIKGEVHVKEDGSQIITKAPALFNILNQFSIDKATGRIFGFEDGNPLNYSDILANEIELNKNPNFKDAIENGGYLNEFITYVYNQPGLAEILDERKEIPDDKLLSLVQGYLSGEQSQLSDDINILQNRLEGNFTPTQITDFTDLMSNLFNSQDKIQNLIERNNLIVVENQIFANITENKKNEIEQKTSAFNEKYKNFINEENQFTGTEKQFAEYQKEAKEINKLQNLLYPSTKVGKKINELQENMKQLQMQMAELDPDGSLSKTLEQLSTYKNYIDYMTGMTENIGNLFPHVARDIETSKQARKDYEEYRNMWGELWAGRWGAWRWGANLERAGVLLNDFVGKLLNETVGSVINFTGEVWNEYSFMVNDIFKDGDARATLYGGTGYDETNLYKLTDKWADYFFDNAVETGKIWNSGYGAFAASGYYIGTENPFDSDEKNPNSDIFVTKYDGNYSFFNRQGEQIYPLSTEGLISSYEQLELEKVKKERVFDPFSLVGHTTDGVLFLYSLMRGGSAWSKLLTKGKDVFNKSNRLLTTKFEVPRAIGLQIQSYNMTYNNYYQEAMIHGLSQRDASQFANQSALVTSSLEMINPQYALMDNIFTRGSSPMNNLLRAYTLDLKKGRWGNAFNAWKYTFMKEIPFEVLQEYSQYGGDLLNKEWANHNFIGIRPFETSVKPDELINIGTITATTIFAGTHRHRQGLGLTFNKDNLLNYLATDENIITLNDSVIPSLLKEGILTKEEAITLFLEINDRNNIISNLPAYLSPEARTEITALEYEIIKLNQEKEKSGRKNTKKIDNQILDLQKLIDKIMYEQEGIESFNVNGEVFTRAQLIEKLNNKEYIQSIKRGDREFKITATSKISTDDIVYKLLEETLGRGADILNHNETGKEDVNEQKLNNDETIIKNQIKEDVNDLNNTEENSLEYDEKNQNIIEKNRQVESINFYKQQSIENNKKRRKNFIKRSDYSIISVDNPAGQQLSEEQNVELRMRFANALSTMGYEFETIIGYNNGVKTVNFIIEDIQTGDAIDLISEYQQSSFISNQKGLVYVDGTYNPLLDQGATFGNEVITNNKQYFIFNINGKKQAVSYVSDNSTTNNLNEDSSLDAILGVNTEGYTEETLIYDPQSIQVGRFNIKSPGYSFYAHSLRLARLYSLGKRTGIIGEQKKVTNKTYVNALVSRLQTVFPNIAVVYDSEKFLTASQENGGNGTERGFALGRTVYLNPNKVTKDTPLHEFGHFWVAALKNSADQNVRNIYNEAIKLIEGTKYFKQTQETYPEYNIEEQLEEALVEAIGDRGAQIYEEKYKGTFNGMYNNIMDYVKSILNIAPSIDVNDMTLDSFLTYAGESLLDKNQVKPDNDIEFENIQTQLDPKLGNPFSGRKPDLFISKRPTHLGLWNNAFSNANQIYSMFPNPLQDENTWNDFSKHIFMYNQKGVNYLPLPPSRLIKYSTDLKFMVNELKNITPDQRDKAEQGLRNAENIKKLYNKGRVSPEETALLFMWSKLSAGTSPYVQESAFLASLYNGADRFLRMARNGKFTQDVFENEYKVWISEILANTPGNGTKHNANAFGKTFLLNGSKIFQEGEFEGLTKIEALHQLMSDYSISHQELRRKFFMHFSDMGFDVKLFDFISLVSGRTDLMVTDRVRVADFWDSKLLNNKYNLGTINIYDSNKLISGEKSKGAGYVNMLSSMQGIVFNEVAANSIRKNVIDAYKELGITDYADIGRFHWETWVSNSSQEVSHGSLDAIVSKIKKDDLPVVGVSQGKYGAWDFGFTYAKVEGLSQEFVDKNGFSYLWETNDGETVAINFETYRNVYDLILEHNNNKNPKNLINGERIVKYKSRKTGQRGQDLKRPWFEHRGANKTALDEYIRDNGTVINRTSAQNQDTSIDRPSWQRNFAPTFFSQIIEQVTDHPRNYYTIQEVSSLLSPKNGVRQTELDFIGFDDFIKELQEQEQRLRDNGTLGKRKSLKISKDDVLKYVAQNVPNIVVHELTDYGGYHMMQIREEDMEYLQKEFGVEGVAFVVVDGKYKDIKDAFQKNGVVSTHPNSQSAFSEIETLSKEAPVTKYSKYIEDGSNKNYREILLTIPDYKKDSSLQESQFIDKGHFYNPERNMIYPNILGFLRVTDRTTYNGKKILFVEEMQSDWSRNQYYKNYTRASRLFSEKYGTLFNVPLKEQGLPLITDNPFGAKWQDLLIKQAIRIASEENYDGVVFNNGTNVQNRYNLTQDLNYFDVTILSAEDFIKTQFLTSTKISAKHLEHLFKNAEELDYDKMMELYYKHDDPSQAIDQIEKLFPHGIVQLNGMALDAEGAPFKVQKKSAMGHLQDLVYFIPNTKNGMVEVGSLKLAPPLSNQIVFETKQTWDSMQEGGENTSSTFQYGNNKQFINNYLKEHKLYVLSGSIGGEWAINLYDKQIPNKLKNVLKKIDPDASLINDVKITIDPSYSNDTFDGGTGIMFTDKINESVLYKGQPMWQKGSFNPSSDGGKAYNQMLNDQNNELQKHKNKFRRYLRTYLTREMFVDKNAFAKDMLRESGAIETIIYRQLIAGSSAKAKQIFKKIDKQIYGTRLGRNRLSKYEKLELDKIIQAQRDIAIAEYYRKKGQPVPKNPNGMTAEEAQTWLDEYQSSNPDLYNKLNERAEIYFNQMTLNLEEAYKVGIVNKETFELLQGVKYSPRWFVHHMFKQEASGGVFVNNSTNKILKQLKDGSEEALFNDSRTLLQATILMTQKAAFKNRANQSLADFLKNAEGYPGLARTIGRNLKIIGTKSDKVYVVNNRGEIIEGTEQDLIENKAERENQLNKLNSIATENNGQVITIKGEPIFENTPSDVEIIQYYKDGVVHKIAVDPLFAKSWADASSTSESSAMVTNIARLLSGSVPLRVMATGINIKFAVTNFIKDITHAFYFTDNYSSFLPVAAIQMIKDLVTVLPEVVLRGDVDIKSFKGLRNKFKDWSTTGLYEDYINHGGGMEFLTQQGKPFVQGELDTRDNAMKDGFNTLFNWLSWFNESSELMVRLAVYQRSIDRRVKEMGDDFTEGHLEEIKYFAANDARALMDFSQGGHLTKGFDTVMPYLNAGFQAFRVGANHAYEKPGHFAFKSLQLLSIAGAFAIRNLQFGYADDEEKYGDWQVLSDEEYMNKYNEEKPEIYPLNYFVDHIPQHIQDSYLCIILPGTKLDEGKPIMNYISIPIPPDTKGFLNIANQMSRWMATGDGVDFNKLTHSMNESLPFPVLSPIEFFDRIPVLGVYNALVNNKDNYTDRAIWSEQNYKAVEEWRKYYTGVHGTQDFFVDLGSATAKENIDTGWKVGGWSPSQVERAYEKLFTSTKTNWLNALFLDVLYEGLVKGKPLSEDGDDAFTMTEVFSKSIIDPIGRSFFRQTNPHVQEENVNMRQFTNELNRQRLDIKQIVRDFAGRYKEALANDNQSELDLINDEFQTYLDTTVFFDEAMEGVTETGIGAEGVSTLREMAANIYKQLTTTKLNLDSFYVKMELYNLNAKNKAYQIMLEFKRLRREEGVSVANKFFLDIKSNLKELGYETWDDDFWYNAPVETYDEEQNKVTWKGGSVGYWLNQYIKEANEIEKLMINESRERKETYFNEFTEQIEKGKDWFEGIDMEDTDWLRADPRTQ